ncbi:MAG: putative Phospholipid-transporting ATPase 2, partial [Streblomastix strix]
ASTWVPIIVIFAISALKEMVKSEDLYVGDVVRMNRDEEFPCDLVMLACSNEQDQYAFVETINIDGESNLKRNKTSCEDLIEKYISHKAETLNQDNLLLQATTLRSTDWIIGCVVYTGNETRIGCSKNKPPTKKTQIDKQFSVITIFVFVFQLALVIALSIAGIVWRSEQGVKMWYLDYTILSESYKLETIAFFLRFLTLMSLFIPVSIKVMLDLLKLFSSLLISVDNHLWDNDQNRGAISRSTSITEQLGLVSIALVDKTGTITCNEMSLTACSIGKLVFGVDDQYQQQKKNNNKNKSPLLNDKHLLDLINKKDPQTINFFRSLAICHSIQTFRKTKELTYNQTQSNQIESSTLADQQKTIQLDYQIEDIEEVCPVPDEQTLVDISRSLGIKFVRRDSNIITLNVLGNEEKYEVLADLSFTPVRKRMTVAVKRVDGIDQRFGQLGLRTLIVAIKYVDFETFQQWNTIHYEKALASVDRREERVNQACDIIETDLTPLGTTGISDKLQDQATETIT